VAYLSADFHEHATAYLMAELFERHDRSRFEVTGVSWGPDIPSALRSRLIAGFERFVDVRGRNDREVARWLRAQEIDIAVDLKGYTHKTRMGIFAQRPAPVQATYLGFPGTLGAEYMDYVVADEVVIPGGEREHYAERVVYLPGSYQVNDGKRAIAERTPTRGELGLPERGFVFCSFNNNYKITPGMFDVWMRLLKGVEGSVLWLLEGNAAAPGNLRREAQARGVAGERLVFARRAPLAEHLARQRVADVFLDTLPCNAHTTASDALWAGLPVLTCLGGTFAGRVAGSLLRAVGLPELVTESAGEYEAKALALAREPEVLAAVRAKLAANRGTSALFDAGRFARHLEAAYVTMWERAERGEPPQGFTVAPIAA
jgi:predicted O-linked N-acetylglucosamine transferase (SPINDLY family)